MVFKKTKRGISPVIAAALLIVAAVIAVVGFQAWLSSYQGDVEEGVDDRTTDGSISIHRIEYDSTSDEDKDNLRIYLSSPQELRGDYILINGEYLTDETCGFFSRGDQPDGE